VWKGVVVSIHIAPAASQPTVAVNAVHAVPGKGLEGDRYFNQAGTFSAQHQPHREVTLIEIEALEALRRDHGIELDPGESRRNIVTRGVPLNHLMGHEFRVGEVALRGLRLCEPCSHLAQLTQPGILPALVHRGGLRAQVVSGGMIRVGDAVEEGGPGSS
jgi:MOSC domain-containing protein YiiM